MRKLVGTGRFELPTCRLGGGRSIQLSYVPTLVSHSILNTRRHEPLADVCPELHSFELNVSYSAVCIPDRSVEAVAIGCYAQHTSAGSLQASIRQPCARVEDFGARLLCFLNPADDRARAGLVRIPLRGHHNARRGLGP